jgi:glutamate racemase
MLPKESIIYLGDTARVPYGSKSHATIQRYAVQAGDILARYNPKLIVVACNTASAHGLTALQASSSCPVVGVIEPGAEAASAIIGEVGVIGTLATIQSLAYEKAILHRNQRAIIHSLACPLLVSLAEEGWLDDPITDAICHRYLDQMPSNVNTIVLGCTHYPILLSSLARARPNTRWLDSGELTAKTVEHILQKDIGTCTNGIRGSLQILLTDASSRLKEVGERFLSENLETVNLVDF